MSAQFLNYRESEHVRIIRLGSVRGAISLVLPDLPLWTLAAIGTFERLDLKITHVSLVLSIRTNRPKHDGNSRSDAVVLPHLRENKKLLVHAFEPLRRSPSRNSSNSPEQTKELFVLPQVDYSIQTSEMKVNSLFLKLMS